MVVPYLHTGDFTSLPADVGAEVLALTQRTVAALTAEYLAEGFNVGMNLGQIAGGSISASPARPRRAALGRRHQLHAGHGRNQGAPRDAAADLSAPEALAWRAQ